jgi:hypothetical protein
VSDEMPAGVRFYEGHVCIGVEWDEGYCEQPLTMEQAKRFRADLKHAITLAYLTTGGGTPTCAEEGSEPPVEL